MSLVLMTKEETTFSRAAIVALGNGDEERLRLAAEEYHRICAVNPGVRRARFALTAGAKKFDLNIVRLLEYDRSHRITQIRQELMAFAWVVGLPSGRPGKIAHPSNSFKDIGRAFHRSHATVMHAVDKYETLIIAALRRTP